MAPRGTPPGIVKMLNREVNAVMNSPAVKNRLAADGAEVAAPNTPEQFRAMIAEEIGKWEKIVRRLDMDKKPAK
jgi:tripartite-type tricarboxylate transporter receptor subunit TctC